MSTTVTTSTATPDAELLKLGYTPSLKRQLGFGAILVYGLLFFVPMAPIAVFGIVTNRSGGVPLLVYLVAAAVMGLSAVSYRTMALRYPVAGSVYGYTRLATNRWLGFTAGWLILLDYLLMPGLLTVLSAIALEHVFPSVPVVLFPILFVGASLVLNLKGIEITTRAGLVLLAAQLVVLGIFGTYVALAIADGRIQPTLLSLWRPETSFALVLGAVPIAALSFLGFDAVNTLNEEARGGGKAVARATTVLLGAITALFCLQLWAAAIVTNAASFPPGAGTNRAFYAAVDLVCPPWFTPVFTFTNAFVAIFSCLVVAHAASARLLFAMARDRLLPAALARTNRAGVPATATITVAAATLVLAVGFAGQAELMTSLVTFGALTSYVVLHIAVVSRFVVIERSRRWLVHLVVPIVGAAGLLLSLARTNDLTRTIGLVWLALGLAAFLTIRTLKRSA